MNTEIKVFVGVDMAKGDHYAQAITTDGVELFSRPVQNDQAAIETMLDEAAVHGPIAVVLDMTSAGAQLLLGVMVQRRVPVAYVSGLVMRRAADLYAGAAKTDPRDAWVLADYARRNPDRLNWLEISDELLAGLSNRLCEGLGSWVFSGLGLVGWGSGFRVGLGLFSSRGCRCRGFLLVCW